MLFGSADATRRRLLDLGVSHVALCPGLTRAIARTVRSDSLHAMLAAGAMPSWLEPVKLAGGTTIKAWRVVR